MRPDEHKAKDSRKYQARKKNQGDSSAAEIAQARRKAVKANDRGTGIAAIRRRNGDFVQETEEEKEERKALQAKYSKRGIATNYDRYEEETEQDRIERDAELGIDRETTDLVTMLEDIDEGGSTLFKFKDEQLFSGEQKQTLHKNMLQVDFQSFIPVLESIDTQQLLGLTEADSDLVDDMLNYHPVVPDKPIVPAFNKNAKGYVIFNKQQQQQPIRNVAPEVDGIYLRNDGSNHPVMNAISSNKSVNPSSNTVEKKPKENQVTDDLDELLAIDHQKNEEPLKKATLPKPGSIKKKPVIAVHEDSKDDEAWLDDLLDE
ncbi:hypothetical protein G6F37_010964 [Rhizopus arrhizus]|nr:hypothetical protein G6F38_002384 [Rhizopus arrhizus]KAG1151572.1 hypothetical protein G6F37_010964 [Rhizopus arrhizus]